MEYLNSDSISGVDFFDSALKACEDNMNNGLVLKTEALFEKLYTFLNSWDSSSFEKPPRANDNMPPNVSKSLSMLSQKCQFPDNFFSSEEKLSYFNTKFGFSQRSIST